MFQESNVPPLSQKRERKSSLLLICTELFVALLGFVSLVGGYAALLTVFASHRQPSVAHAAVIQKHVHIGLDIVMDQPGMQQDWPAYSPTNLVVPAHSLVTVTLRNYDLGDTPLPADSPFTKVQGTIGGIATADGQAYHSLSPEKVAHTFTISQLHINVPVPGDGPKGAAYTTVSFTFYTGEAGVYTFQCFDPCGTGSSGWMGPMMTKGYMIGTLTVQ